MSSIKPCVPKCKGKRKLKRAYVEITNQCNFHCTFCPGTRRKGRYMSPEEFYHIAAALRGEVEYLYLHVMGEPLLHPRLEELLAIAAAMGFRICVTTNGTLLREKGAYLLACPALHKASISLHAMEGNGAQGLREYLDGVWTFAQKAQAAGSICALRLWNLGGREAWNGEILGFLESKLGVPPLSLPEPRRGSWKLGERLYLERARQFTWPDMSAPEANVRFCLGLREQIAVLADGTVVPCCLDHEGDIPLGNLLREPLEAILSSPRAQAIYEGFSQGKPVEPLCRRCGYAREREKP